jgi:long-chain acyl-CoA synthetase
MAEHDSGALEKLGVEGPRTLFDILVRSRDAFGDDVAYIYRAGDQEIEVKYGKVLEDVLLLARAFADRGVARDHRVMFLSDNRYSWIVTDLAIMSLGAVSVPRGSDTPPPELLYIMQNSNCTHLVVESPALFETHRESLKKVDNLKTIFVMTGPAMHSLFGKTYSYQDLLRDRTYSEADVGRFIERGEQLEAEDLLTVIYTSGTTGMPKGVKLTHANVMHNINCIPGIIELRRTDRWLSILPSWHIFERTAEYVAFSQGCCLVYSSVKTFSQDLEQYRPNEVATVPRVWESLYNKVQAALVKKGRAAASLFALMVSISKRYRRNRRILLGQLPVFTDHASIFDLFLKAKALLVCAMLYLPYRLARKKLSLVQQRFGGRLRLAVSGGGSLVDFLEDWLDAVGIRIVNAYGMTECSPAIAGRGLNCSTYGTVGFPATDTEVRIVSESGDLLPTGAEGLIEVRGPQVTGGYDNNEVETKKAFTSDGFLKTGDLGMLTVNNELLITGRAKDIIVLASGENIDPSRIESTITTFPFIEDAVLVGQDRKGLGALLVPDLEELRAWVGNTFDSLKKEKEQLLTDSTILERVRKEINLNLKPNRGFKPYERLHGITFLEKSLQKGEELTSTLKKKRHIIEKNYRGKINQLFS